MDAQLNQEIQNSEIGSLGSQSVSSGSTGRRNNINVALRPHHFRCRLCAFSGFSSDCDFMRIDECAGTIARLKE